MTEEEGSADVVLGTKKTKREVSLTEKISVLGLRGEYCTAWQLFSKLRMWQNVQAKLGGVFF